MFDLPSRRAFLRIAAAAGAGWAAADLVQVDAALAWAHQANTTGNPPLAALSPEQGAALEAMASRILPAVDGRPGARELGVLTFIDRSLSTFAADQQTVYAAGARDLDARAATARAGERFASLTPAEQDAVLHQIEATPFFQAVRFATLVGAFALPSYGGNRDFAGWHLIGLDHQPSFQAPFGYYDAAAAKKR